MIPRPSHLVFAFLLFLTVPMSVSAQSLHESFWVTDGPVYAVEPYFDLMFIGGQFQRVGPPTGSGAVTNRSTGALEGPPLHINGVVHAVVADGSGGWFLGGSFTTIRGITRRCLAHIDATGNVTAWAPQPDATVRSILLSGGMLYVGGDFTTIAGVARSRLAALDPASGAVNSWDPGANGSVRFLGSFSSLIYVGGEFTAIGGTTRNRVAALHPATGALQTWNPNVNGPVNAVFRSGLNLAIGGLFSMVGGQPRTNLAIITSSGTLAPATNVNGEVFAFTADPSNVYMVGDFTTVLGQSRQRLTAFDLTLSVLRPWNPGADARVRTILFIAGQLWIGGDFANAGNAPRNGAANLSTADDFAGSWNPNAAGPVHAVAVDPTRAFIGGNFFSVGWVARQNLAAIITNPASADRGKAHAFNPGVTGTVMELELAFPWLLVGGSFTAAAGQPRSNFAVIDVVGNLSSWAPAVNSPVNALGYRTGHIWVGGAFSSIGGDPSQGLAALDLGGGVRPEFLSPPNTGHVYDIKEVDSERVYVAGSFDTLRGSPRNGLGQVNADAGVATSWTPFPPDSAALGATVLAVEAGDEIVYAGGAFQQFGVFDRQFLLAFHVSTGAAEPWSPNPDGVVTAMRLALGRLYIGGEFYAVQGQPREFLAAFIADGQAPGPKPLLVWAPTLDGVPADITTQSNTEFHIVAVCGSFKTVNNFHHPNIAFLDDQTFAIVGVDAPILPRTSLTLTPNPVRVESRARFVLGRAGTVTLRLFDIQGREVARPLDDVWLEAGSHEARLDARRLAPGLYGLRLDGAEGAVTGKLVVVR